MANLKERNIRRDEAAKMGREKAKDEASLEERIDQGHGHVNNLQLGNQGNLTGQPPLTEQEKRNRGESHAATGGEAATRPNTGEGPRPSEPARNEKVEAARPDRDHKVTNDRPKSTGPERESRPTHP